MTRTDGEKYAAISCHDKLCEKPSSCSGSTSYQNVPYGDGNFTDGIVSTETLAITSVSGTTSLVPNFLFECGSHDESYFFGADRVVGLGRRSFSMSSQLAPSPFVPNDFDNTSYFVQIESISVDGKKLSIPASAFDIDLEGNGGTILDSGSPLGKLVEPAYDPLVRELKSTIKCPARNDSGQFGFDLCYDVSGVSVPVFPVISFHFAGGAEYVFPQLNSFAPNDNNGTTCLTVISNDDSGSSYIGNLQQQNFFILFDEENKQFGFKPQQCVQGQ